MKKMNKKMQLILIGMALILVSVASTYAWWTASKTIDQKITMGNLKIEANFAEGDLEDFEPGLDSTIAGTIKNVGSIDAMVRVDNDSSITFVYSDDDLTPIAPANQKPEQVDPENIKINIEAKDGDYTGDGAAFWLKDSDNNKYVLMTPNSEVKVNVLVDFVGKKVTNQYMDSTIDLKAKIDATQVLEGAGQDVWGISFENDLSNLPETDNLRTARSTKSTTDGRSYLLSLLERGK